MPEDKQATMSDILRMAEIGSKLSLALTVVLGSFIENFKRLQGQGFVYTDKQMKDIDKDILDLAKKYGIPKEIITAKAKELGIDIDDPTG